jgi:hypothetical protein
MANVSANPNSVPRVEHTGVAKMITLAVPEPDSRYVFNSDVGLEF